MNNFPFCLLLTLFVVDVFCNILDGSNYLNKLVLKSSFNEIQNPGICSHEARCEHVHNFTCFGTPLPYTSTSIALAHDSITQQEIQDNLALWAGLRSVPRCWAVVQPFLCSVYMPKCENNTLLLPSQEMCRITRARCRAVEAQKGWPAFLQCENKKLFPPGCRNPLQEVKFNTTFKCIKPLVETENSHRWYNDIEGCGLQCENPLFTEKEHNYMNLFIRICTFLCFLSNLFTVVTCLISWEVCGRYPYIFIFYINTCLCFSFFGWLIFSTFKEKTVCREDGTRHKTGENGASVCVVAFFFIYCCLITALALFVILTQAWCSLFRQSHISQKVGKKQWFSLLVAAIAVSVVLALIVFLINGIEGDSISGICFVGSSPSLRGGFLLLPVLFAAFMGGIFLSGGIHALLNLKSTIQERTSGQVKKHIHCLIVRLGMFSFFCLFFVVSTVICHVYEFMHREEWEKSLMDYIVCLATMPVTHAQCVLKHHPNIHVLHWHFSALFGFGLLMASWVWTPTTFKLWKQFFCSIKVTKCCCFTFNLKNIKEDPIGMNLDINNNASRDVPPVLPKFLNRRNTLTAIDQLVPIQYSSASDISLQRRSLDSFHQQNLDSLSQHMSEQEFAYVLRQQRRKTRRERKRYLTANRIAPWYPRSRRGSDTSIQSSIIFAAAMAGNGKVTQATSTGDLNNIADILLPRIPASYVVNRPLVQKPVVQNLPFTHGMTDNSHCLNSRSNAELSGVMNSASQSPFAPLYNIGYGFLPPFGYMPCSTFPSIFPSYLMAANPYPPANVFPFEQFSETGSVTNQSPLIPIHPRADSSSEEKTFLPVIMSDSELTDGGPLSCDETVRLLNEEALLRSTISRFENSQPRPVLEPQVCAKTEFLKKMESTAPISVPNEESFCTEVPPPSPADSDDDNDGSLKKIPNNESLGTVFYSQADGVKLACT